MHEKSDIFLVSNAAGQFGSEPALMLKDRVISYYEYDRLVHATALKLENLALKKGDRLAILSPVCLEYPVLIMALIKRGIVAVPVNTRYPGAYIQKLLEKIDCKNIVVHESMKSLHPGGTVRVHMLKDIAVSSVDRSMNTGPAEQIKFKRDTTIMFTSGSSGEPKAVLHTYGNHYYSALGSYENIAFQPCDSWLLSLPLYHVGGFSILIRAAVHGGTVAIPDYRVPLHESMTELMFSHISLVAAQLRRLMIARENILCLNGAKAIILGGAAHPPALIERAVREGLPLFTSYGSTETASQVTTTQPGERIDRLFTSGKTLRYRECTISGEGEIYVRGETLFKGYIEKGRIDSARDSEGWFHTGDLGSFDENGCLHVSGRKDTMFVSGGENIHPEEIEQRLCMIENIADALVVPVEHSVYGMRPAAFIRYEEGEPISGEAITGRLANYLPKYKIPDHFLPWPPDIESGGLKPDRQIFIQRARELLQGKP
ncbi:o-succinylbenzoate--CoA ligase [candidate division KSB1 bacterium]